MAQSYKVAVIGAGMAGLVTARELRREGHQVTVFEKGQRVGGTWLYNPQVESDLLGLDPNREIVHTSLYRSLRVNLPRHVMGFLDYPFVKKEGGDSRSFPGHAEVLRFLEDFARDFGLMELIRFGHEVVGLERVDEVSHEWVIESRTRGMESRWEFKEHAFEAVIVCNGKNTEPNIAEFPGRDAWPGLQMHSHNYRTPEQFKNKIVVLIGNGPSAYDILKDIYPLARQVHQAIRGPDFQLKKLKNHDNAWQHSMIECAHKDGKVVFQDGSIVDADVIIHCTGFETLFKPLEEKNLLQTLPVLVIELQGKWVAKVLSGKVELPTEEEMAYSVQELYSQMEKTGWPKHHTHKLHPDKFDYETWLVAQLDITPPERWKQIMLMSVIKIASDYGDNYRDEWNVDKWIQEIDSSNNKSIDVE
ncbi:flavin-containing monooxygenase FMO GS-OX5-like isoform X3 [Durio zibethinus]|uniref:Flavin-containing monooxygenase n=1 Tax=Durio zibethinus TaxID=66656 RepID=A0A6P5ZWZ3_DURZI|nr:flavin-containing monooxygenase FMO GS-OX5-like isoform X3 [Durio zibethinus]